MYATAVQGGHVTRSTQLALIGGPTHLGKSTADVHDPLTNCPWINSYRTNVAEHRVGHAPTVLGLVDASCEQVAEEVLPRHSIPAAFSRNRVMMAVLLQARPLSQRMDALAATSYSLPC